MISVVIPLYNKERQITNTLQSVFKQTYTDYEVVIVDDGSTDGSAAAVEAISDRRVRLIRQPNAGVAAARNRGIAEARSKYIALLDADDRWKPDFLATIAHLIDTYPQCDVFATNYEFVDTKGNVSPTILRKLPYSGNEGILSNYFEVASYSHPPICSSCVCVTKEAFEAIGGFPLGIKSGEDLLTWARLASHFQIAYSKSSLSEYHQGLSVPRPPEDIDKVGMELEKILHESSKPSMKKYVAYWYKMRMCRCFGHRMYGKALKGFFKSLWYNPLQAKIYLSIGKYILIGLR